MMNHLLWTIYTTLEDRTTWNKDFLFSTREKFKIMIFQVKKRNQPKQINLKFLSHMGQVLLTLEPMEEFVISWGKD